MVRAIVGGNWGDEGKGKLTDLLSGQSDLVVRFQGGANAGHTVINSYGKFALHLLPSGVFHPEVVNVIAQGVALDLIRLFLELDELNSRGVPEPTLRISDRAQLVLPYHLLFDRLEEERLGRESFGSTQSGIAPFYADKALKIGIQVCELFDEELLRRKIQSSLALKNPVLEALYHAPVLSEEEVLGALLPYRERLRPMVTDTAALLHRALRKGKRILLEGQLGALKDPDNGIYPFTTSSSPLAGFASVGAGIPPHEIREILAVVKAYSSCVGAGAFVTELSGPQADTLRRRGGDCGEFGATTGRPRRMGWFDAVATRYGCMLQSATEAALTLLDVLGYLERIPVCTAYEIDGRLTREFPAQTELVRAKPVYEVLEGWKCDLSGVREYRLLPENAKKYVDFIERQIGVPIRIISNGPGRDEYLLRDSAFSPT